MSPVLDLQRRFRELGRIRMGEKGPKGQPVKLSQFRLTSGNRLLLDRAASLWGGEVREWAGAPSEGQFELYTQADRIPVAFMPGGDPVSQWYEQWTGGGATHRCDGARNCITDKPCSCNPDSRACDIHTRISLVLPDLPDVGVWRLETKGMNAAMELPGTVDLIRFAMSGGQYLTGTLRIEHRTSKQDGQTRRFITPVIDLDVTMASLMAGEGTSSPSIGSGATRAALEAGAVEPEVPVTPAPPAEPDTAPLISAGQRARLFATAKEIGVESEDVRNIARMVLGHGVSSMTADELPKLERAIVRYQKNPEGPDKLAAWVAANPEEAAA